jgi:anti-sigma factor RsiW
MNCNECLENLVAYLEGSVSPDRRARLQAHLEICEPCRAERDALAHLRQRLLRLGPTSEKFPAASEI